MADQSEDSDEEVIQLSTHAMTALQEFYAEQRQKEEQLASREPKNVDIDEDWQLSQFWYSEETASVLAEEVIKASHGGRIACLCAPTLYKELLQHKHLGVDKRAVLFEYDRRFDIYGEHFVFYDFKRPLDLPKSMESHSFDIVFADPPFLSEECLSKVTQTVKYLAKEKVILCTGQIMQKLAMELMDLRLCKFKPKHARNLMNEFACFVNYNTDLDQLPNDEKMNCVDGLDCSEN